MKREKWLDLIKVIACFLVVILHTVRDGLVDGVNNIGLLAFDFGVFAIPLFFMVNGYLQLRKERISYTYCIKKIVKIIAVVLIWNLLYEAVNFVVNGEFKNIFIETLRNLFLQKGTYNQFWFLGVLILIDLFLPLLNKIFQKKNYGLIMTCVFIIICILIDLFNIRNNLLGNDNIRETVLQTFRIWTWLTYFLIGGCISKIKTDKINKKLLYVITIVMIIISVFSIYLCINKLYGDLYVEDCYDNLLIIITASLIFYSIKNINFDKLKNIKIIESIGKLSGGGIHNPHIRNTIC